MAGFESTRNPARERFLRWAPLVVGGALRALSLLANRNFEHGDVNGDASVAQSLAHGLGFWIPWEEGSVFYADALGDTPATWGHPSDSHGPLWPLFGAPFAWLLGSGYHGLQVLSWICGVFTIDVARRVFGRFGDGDVGARAGRFAAWACALSLPMADYSAGGSLYAGQILGILLLPLAAPVIHKNWGALLSGVILGANYLVSYQSALLIPVYTIALWWSMGFVKSIRPLALAAAGCLAVTVPWFVRNYNLWGDPFFTTNPAFFGARVGSSYVDFHTGPRPIFVTVYAPESMWVAMWNWSQVNAGIVFASLAVVMPCLGWFSLGGLGRLLGWKRGERPRIEGLLLIGTLVILFITAVICPQPKTRNIVPMAPILAGAAAVELARGARPFWAVVMAAATGGCLWLVNMGRGDYFAALTQDWYYVVPALAVAFLAFVKPARRWLPVVAMLCYGFYGAARAWVWDSNMRILQFYGPMLTPEPPPFAASATYYDYINEPWAEGIGLARRREAKRGLDALKDAGCSLVCAEAAFATLWKGRILSFRGRAESHDIPRLMEFYGCDGILVSRRLKEDTESVDEWFKSRGAEEVFKGHVLSAYRIPRKQ